MRCAPWVWRRLSVSLWMCVRACARSHLALWTCGNQLGDISPSRRRDANRVFTAAHSIRVKHELWARARPDGCGRCPCVLLFSISIGKTLRRWFFFCFVFFFRAGSFTERRVVLPKQGWGDEEWDLLTTQFASALAHTSCEAHFMILGEFMYLSWLRRRRGMWAQRTPCILFWTYN